MGKLKEKLEQLRINMNKKLEEIDAKNPGGFINRTIYGERDVAGLFAQQIKNEFEKDRLREEAKRKAKEEKNAG